MYHEAGRLIDGQQMFVLVQQVERDGFRLRTSLRRELGHVDANGITG
jgi:hypothetical protein